MADKNSQQLLDALTRAAAEPAGLPLYGTKSETGLFPSNAAGKLAAQRGLADGLLRARRFDANGVPGRDLFTLTDKGSEFLLAEVNPKHVLEDFVRVLESRQVEVDELLATARRMAESLSGLKAAVANVLPRVETRRIDVAALRSADSSSRLRDEILTGLKEWTAFANAGEDCPLPELYRRLPSPTIGEFHDCLRSLHVVGSVYLHPWTGPLYALPEPAYALLIGHGVAYYASPR